MKHACGCVSKKGFGKSVCFIIRCEAHCGEAREFRLLTQSNSRAWKTKRWQNAFKHKQF